MPIRKVGLPCAEFHETLLNNIICRYLLTNFTNMKISLEIWTESHLRPQVKCGFLYANFHDTHDYSIQFGDIIWREFFSSSIKI